MKAKSSKQVMATDDQALAQSFFEVVALLKNSKEVKDFFMDLCTPSELQVMTDRWRVVKPIKQGQPYRKIYAETGVSVTTIGRVARCISYGTGGYNTMYERQEKKRNVTTSKTQNRNSEKG